VLSNAATHARLVRELAVGAKAALAFVEYPNSPEARYPVAIEQGYATAQWIVREGAPRGLDASRMAVASESSAVARRVRRRALPDPQGDGVVLGRVHHRSGGAL
jgi:acetyl esterase/lipase